MNKDRGEKDTDARRRRRCPDDRRGWIINSFPVAIVTIRPIITVVIIPMVIIPTSTVIVISAEGRQHVDTADHGG
jgi:hypothetical protein